MRPVLLWLCCSIVLCGGCGQKTASTDSDKDTTKSKPDEGSSTSSTAALGTTKSPPDQSPPNQSLPAKSLPNLGKPIDIDVPTIPMGDNRLSDLATSFGPPTAEAEAEAEKSQWSYLATSFEGNPYYAMQPITDMAWNDERKVYADTTTMGPRSPNRRCLVRQIQEDTVELLPSVARTAIVRWTAPGTGLVRVRGLFAWAGEEGDAALEGIVLVDGGGQYRSEVRRGDAPKSFDFTALVGAGSTIDFIGCSFADQVTDERLVARVTVDVTIDPEAEAIEKEVAELGSSHQPVSLSIPAKNSPEAPSQVRAPLTVPPSVQDPEAIEFLQESGKWIVSHPESMSTEEIEAKGRALIQAGMTNPYVLCDYARITLRRPQWAERTSQTLSLFSLDQLSEDPGRLMFASFQQTERHASSPNVDIRQALMSFRIAVGILSELCSEKDMDDATRIRLDARIRQMQDSAATQRLSYLLVSEFLSNPDIDPWLRDVAVGRELSTQAWQVRGNGVGSSVSPERSRQFHIYLQRARRRFLAAWKARPTLAEAPGRMIVLSMATNREPPRFWLDQAVKADFADARAYESYLRAILPRWGGSHKALLNFGRECLATERFDTRVPAFYHWAIGKIDGDQQDGSIYQAEGVLNDYQNLRAGYRDADEINSNELDTVVLGAEWLAGNRAKAIEIYNRLGDDVSLYYLSRMRVDTFELREATGTAITNSIGMELLQVEAGEFQMGSPESEEKRETHEVQHLVRITGPIWVGRFEVTSEQYSSVMGSEQENSKFPATSVTWNEANEFCRQLTANEAQFKRVYRLPTEAEWEYLCRAGAQTAFSWGDSASSRRGNFLGSKPYKEAAGPNYNRILFARQFPPNAFGLYDMHGNVWEWCSDWYGAYDLSSADDPTGPSTGTEKIFRGGAYTNAAQSCRSANRNKKPPTFRNAKVGFRVVCTIAPE